MSGVRGKLVVEILNYSRDEVTELSLLRPRKKRVSVAEEYSGDCVWPTLGAAEVSTVSVHGVFRIAHFLTGLSK